MTATPDNPIINAVTVDVEDWIQSVFDNDAPLTDRFVTNTERVLSLFERCGVRGTFFVLGLAAEKAPELIRRIQASGHEVQSHGYAHRLIHTQTKAQLYDDLDRSKKLLEDITGSPITGYRAPAFSIGPRHLWALDVIAECGFTYDASICPAKTRRYGIAHAPHRTHRIITPAGHTLLEIPVATASRFGRRTPAGGGGYLRLYPVGFVRRAIEAINRTGSASAIYMHPYEFAPTELAELSSPNLKYPTIPWKTKLHQGLGRSGFAAKIERLLRTCRFGTMSEVIATAGDWPCCRYALDGSIAQTAIIKEASAPAGTTLAGKPRTSAEATTYGAP